MISFYKIGCKGTTFCAHSQIKMHKNSQNVHTLAVLCNEKYSLTSLTTLTSLLNQITQDVARQFLGDGARSGTCGILGHTTSGGSL